MEIVAGQYLVFRIAKNVSRHVPDVGILVDPPTLLSCA
jgi:hypothetical protein